MLLINPTDKRIVYDVIHDFIGFLCSRNGGHCIEDYEKFENAMFFYLDTEVKDKDGKNINYRSPKEDVGGDTEDKSEESISPEN